MPETQGDDGALIFRAIADSTYDWETWVGPDGRTRWINPAVERLTGRSVAECLAMADYPLCLVHDDDRPSIREALRGAARGTAGNDLELRIEHADGSVRWAAMSWQSLLTEDGRAVGYRTSIRDIGDRKRAEHRLLDALRRAQAGERARATLLASVSHELRTPIHNLLGYAQLLARRALDDGAREQVAIIREQGEALAALVDDLLDVSAEGMRRAPRPRRRFDLMKAVTRVAEAHRARIEAKGLRWELEIPAEPFTCRGDRAGLEQVLRILLDNATKYTALGRVSVQARATSEGDAIVEVRDSGIGIDRAELPEIRRAFVRGAESSQHHIDGLGLGLAIADRLCAQMGATLTIESERGVGSCFSLRVPASATTGPRRSRKKRAPRHALDVLVVDDRALGREMVAEMVRALGSRSDVAAGARDALELVSARRYDVVLLDVHMPELDGYAAVHLLRAQLSAAGRRARVIALTADVFAIGELERHGFDGHLSKPLRLDALEATLFPDDDHARPGARPGGAAIDVADDSGVGRRTALLARFAPKIAAELRALAGALREDDAADLVRTVHSLRGTAQIVDRTALVAATDELSAAIRAADLDAIRALRARVADAADRVAAEIDG